MCDRNCRDCEYKELRSDSPECFYCVGTYHKPNFKPKETKTCSTCRYGTHGCCSVLACVGCYNLTSREYRNWKPLIEDLESESEKFMKKIDIDINTGYRYVDTDSATTNNLYTELSKIEKFCNENDIYWDINYVSGMNMCYYNFKHRPSNKLYKLTLYLDGLRSTSIIEKYIITKLRKAFNLKEENTMSTKNYGDIYRKGSLFGYNKPEIKDVKFSGPCTIVFWSDGDKTIVRCGEDDKFDKEKGLAIAVAKKFLGTNKSKSNFNDIFKKWIQEEENEKKDKHKEVKLMSVKQLAKKEGVSESAIRKKINKGQYPGAFKNNGIWWIPID